MHIFADLFPFMRVQNLSK